MMAIDKGMVAVAALMVERGANLDADKDGKTPLMMAIDKGMVAVAALMVERGANLDAVAQVPRQRGYSDRFKVQLPSFELCRSRSSSISRKMMGSSWLRTAGQRSVAQRLCPPLMEERVHLTVCCVFACGISTTARRLS